jgi:hypothetical protein
MLSPPRIVRCGIWLLQKRVDTEDVCVVRDVENRFAIYLGSATRSGPGVSSILVQD